MPTPASRPQQPGLARPLALLLALLPCGLAAEEEAPPSAAVVSANALVAHGKTETAIAVLEAWCKDHPGDHLAAHALLADKVALMEKQIAGLLAVQASTQDATVPASEPPTVARTAWTFAEKIPAAERATIEGKLDQKVRVLCFDGTNGIRSAQVRELLTALFSLTGINYVLLDDAIGNERLTIHLVDVSVGDALATIAKLVKVRFNYSGNTVYVTSIDKEVMETRIIRLQSGLSDVDTELQPETIAGALPGAKGQGQPGDTVKSDSDLERLLDQAPDLIAGWPADAKMYLDRTSNSLYVRSTPSTINELQRLIDSTLPRPRPHQ